jgi:hypothetical protein
MHWDECALPWWSARHTHMTHICVCVCMAQQCFGMNVRCQSARHAVVRFLLAEFFSSHGMREHNNHMKHFSFLLQHTRVRNASLFFVVNTHVYPNMGRIACLRVYVRACVGACRKLWCWTRRAAYWLPCCARICRKVYAYAYVYMCMYVCIYIYIYIYI